MHQQMIFIADDPGDGSCRARQKCVRSSSVCGNGAESVHLAKAVCDDVCDEDRSRECLERAVASAADRCRSPGRQSPAMAVVADDQGRREAPRFLPESIRPALLRRDLPR
jgi:hypothetical protein